MRRAKQLLFLPGPRRHPQPRPIGATGAAFLASHTDIAIVILGAIFLVVTGAEALYVDLGHFGRRPIVVAWFVLVFPCLLLNYFGQGTFIFSHPESVEHPFFQMLPVVILATAATVIASHLWRLFLIRQAMHLNLLPRFHVRHTSETHPGQIYLSQVNFLLFISVIVLVVIFKTSSALSAAYGIAVTGEMLIIGILLFVVMRRIWKWRLAFTLAILTPLVLIDTGFFISNVAKFAQGRWVPVVVALTIAFLMHTWVSGRRLLAKRTKMNWTEVELQRLYRRCRLDHHRRPHRQ